MNAESTPSKFVFATNFKCLKYKGSAYSVLLDDSPLAYNEENGLHMQTLADRLRISREKKGLTQQELADLAGTTQQNIQNIEAGVVQRPRKIGAIAKALGDSPAWLQFGVEAIDKLDAEAIELAMSWMDLDEPQKSAMKNAILGMSKRPSRKNK